MKRLGILVALIVGAVVIYSLAFPSVTVRYRLTLEAQVDGEPRTGSGVIEVTYAKQSRFAGQRPGIETSRGEAVVLDLGPRGALFALLKADTDSRSIPETIVLRAFGFPGGVLPGPIDAGLRQLQHLSGKRELPLTSLPLLVRFREPKDPKTVERVDPLNVAKSLGAGARLIRASIEIVPAGIWPLNSLGITGERITRDIENRLPWLRGMRTNIDGTSIVNSNRLSNELNSGDFRRD
jgi:hypothetical protein